MPKPKLNQSLSKVISIILINQTVEAEVNQAKLRAEALKIECQAEIDSKKRENEAEVNHKKALIDLEVKKAKELAEIETKKLKQIIKAIGQDTITKMAKVFYFVLN